MTNAQIIFNASVKLMNEGVIGNTGRTITVENAEGERVEVFEPEPIHTYSAWKQFGRQVKKGEKCKADILIWKASRRPAEEPAEGEEPSPDTIRMFMKRAFFFTYAQTEPITATN